ncbi:hypothetical protein AP3_002 [Salmonella phage TS3]|nr:hypothetical protein AP3_002 [Salmonella phage TS3]
MTLLEIAAWFLQLVILTVVCVTWPVGYWFWGYVMYANIKHYVLAIDGDLE